MSKKLVRGIMCLVLTLALVIPSCVTPSVKAAAAEKQQITINKKEAKISVGDELQLVSYGTTKAVTWATSDKKIAAVSKTGLVTAKEAGKATITATSDGKSYKCVITVEGPTLSESKITVAIGENTSVILNGTEIESVTTSDKKIAIATKENGYVGWDESPDRRTTGSENWGELRIYGRGKGTATITAKGKDGKSYKVTVKVTEPYVVVKSTEVYVDKDDEDYSSTETYEYKYDKYGNTIYEKTTRGKNVTVIEREYHDNCQIKKECTTETENGKQTRYSLYEYNELGNTLTRICKNSWSEEERHIEYDKNGYISKESSYEVYDDDVDAWSAAYEHDDNGRLTKEIIYDGDVEKEVNEYTYDADGNRIKEVNYKGGKKNSEYEYKYDKGNTVYSKSVYYEDGKVRETRETKREYNAYGFVTKTENYINGKLDDSTQYWYVGIREGVPGLDYDYYDYGDSASEMHYVYESQFSLNKYADGKQYGATVKTDKSGRVTSAEENGTKYSFKFDSKDRVIGVTTEESGKKTERVYEYDANGRRTLKKTVEGGKVTFLEEYKFSDKGEQIFYHFQTSYSEQKNETVYDENGRKIKWSYYSKYGDEDEADDKSETYSYDKAGNCTKLVRVVNGKTTTQEYKYNDFGKIISYVEKDTDGKVTGSAEYKYDKLGNKIFCKETTTNRYMSGSSNVKTTEDTWEYDDNSELVHNISQCNTVYYDENGKEYSYDNTYTEEKYEGETTVYSKYESDQKDERRSSYDLTERSFNSDGKLLSSIDKSKWSESEETNVYDKKGNLISSKTSVVYSDEDDEPETSEYTYTYDDKGNMIKEVRVRKVGDGDPKTTTSTWTYDKQGRITSSEDGTKKCTYTYDKTSGLLKTMVEEGKYSKRTYTYEYKLLSKVAK